MCRFQAISRIFIKNLNISSLLYLTLVCMCFKEVTLTLPEHPSASKDLHEKVSKKLTKKNDILPPCQLCRTLVNSFQKVRWISFVSKEVFLKFRFLSKGYG